MSINQQIITIAAVALATMLTRFLPFFIFSGKKRTPKYIEYLGTVLPGAMFALLVVYSLKSTNILTGSHGIPELISIAAIVLIHVLKRNMLVSIAAGTVIYMLLVQFIF